MAARDAGLVRGIGLPGLSANLFNITLGAGIFVIPATLAGAAGANALWIYAICAVAMTAVVMCFAEGGSRVPSSGGAYAFVETAFGPFWGYLTGVLIWVNTVLAAGGIAAAATDQLSVFVPELAGGIPRALTIVGWFGWLAWVNIRSTRWAARIVGGSILLKLVPLAVFILIGATRFTSANFYAPIAVASKDLAHALFLGLFLFTGVESGLTVSGEVRAPSTTVPRALLIVIAGYTLLVMMVHLVAQGALGAALPLSKAPLGDALRPVSPALAAFLIGGAALSMLGWIASDVLSSPRSLFALGRDGVLPTIFGRVNTRYHTPQVAIMIHCAVAATLAVSGGFNGLVILATLAVVPVYVLACVGAVALRRRDVALAGRPMRMPGLYLWAGLGILSMVMLTFQANLGEVGALALLLLSLSVLWLRRRSRRSAI